MSWGKRLSRSQSGRVAERDLNPGPSSAKYWMLQSSFHSQASSAGDGRDSVQAGRRWGHRFLLEPSPAPSAYLRPGQLAASFPPSGSESTPLLFSKTPQTLLQMQGLPKWSWQNIEIEGPSRDTQHSLVKPAQDTDLPATPGHQT